MKQSDMLDALIDRPRLTAWLDENIPALGDGPLNAKLISGGTSNAIIGLNRGGETLVLRRPPTHKLPGNDKAMAREARVLSALNQTDVPHPHVYAWSDDQDVIGATFYVMELVDGWAAQLTDNDCLYPDTFNTPEGLRSLGFALADGLVNLAGVDYQAVGLEGFGKTERFLERQVDRWLKQLASYKETYQYSGRDIPHLNYVSDWLRANIPENFTTGIIHGDYGAPNVLMHHDQPARLAAIIDWELSTIGDPLLDLGWLSFPLCRHGSTEVPAGSYYDSRHFPSREEMIAYYGEQSGRDVSHADYYLVLAQFKLAVLVEAKVARAAIGQASEQVGKFFSKMVLGLIDDAARIARQAG